MNTYRKTSRLLIATAVVLGAYGIMAPKAHAAAYNPYYDIIAGNIPPTGYSSNYSNTDESTYSTARSIQRSVYEGLNTTPSWFTEAMSEDYFPSSAQYNQQQYYYTTPTQQQPYTTTDSYNPEQQYNPYDTNTTNSDGNQTITLISNTGTTLNTGTSTSGDQTITLIPTGTDTSTTSTSGDTDTTSSTGSGTYSF